MCPENLIRPGKGSKEERKKERKIKNLISPNFVCLYDILIVLGILYVKWWQLKKQQRVIYKNVLKIHGPLKDPWSSQIRVPSIWLLFMCISLKKKLKNKIK